MSAYAAIYTVVCQIPRGKVATYGQVAALANLPGQARLVGYALYQLDMATTDVPWQRVINAQGKISTANRRYGSDVWQRTLLEEEGIVFSKAGKVDFSRDRWQPSLAEMEALGLPE